MAWTQEQLAELDKLIAEGVSAAAYADRRVTYRSLEELRSIRDGIQRELDGGRRREYFTTTQFSKGLQ